MMWNIIIRCPFGHECEYHYEEFMWKCTKCNQSLSMEHMHKWFTEGPGMLDHLIWVPVPKLVIDIPPPKSFPGVDEWQLPELVEKSIKDALDMRNEAMFGTNVVTPIKILDDILGKP